MKVVLEKQKCIGCGTCQALCARYFELGGDGKAVLKGSKAESVTGNDELELPEPDCVLQAVDGCPVECIHIER